jgi:phosphate-selective porin OprO and OprP
MTLRDSLVRALNRAPVGRLAWAAVSLIALLSQSLPASAWEQELAVDQDEHQTFVRQLDQLGNDPRAPQNRLATAVPFAAPAENTRQTRPAEPSRSAAGGEVRPVGYQPPYTEGPSSRRTAPALAPTEQVGPRAGSSTQLGTYFGTPHNLSASPAAAPNRNAAMPLADPADRGTLATEGPRPLPAVSQQVRPAGYQPSSSIAIDGAESPVLDPNQPGNLNKDLDANSGAVSQNQLQSPVLDPNQAGNLDRRLNAVERRLQSAGGTKKDELPLIRLSGFMQLDEGWFGQSVQSMAQLGDIQDGIGFRRARLQAIGKLTEFTGYSIEMDFATVGRPSFMDVWGEQAELPFFGTIRIGQFRQPGTMDSWTSVRHLEFLERSLPFQAIDPFRRVGIMSYAMSEDERTMWAYSMYGTGLTFFNGTGSTYSTLGDTRAGTQIGDSGGVSFAARLTHLLYYDDLSQGRYLLHIGGGYNFSEIGGSGTTGSFAKTYDARPIPEFFVGDPAGGGLTAAGTPVVVDSGRILANSFNVYHTELAGNYGPAHFQTEFMCASVNQLNGPAVFYPGAYFQCGYFLTGESCLYLKQAGVLDYNVVPYSDFFGIGRRKWTLGGFGAWEVAFRWSWMDLSGSNILPANQLSASAGPPPAPNPGVVNETTLALNWWWNRFTRMQLNWIHSMPKYPVLGTAPFDVVGGRFQIEF